MIEMKVEMSALLKAFDNMPAAIKRKVARKSMANAAAVVKKYASGNIKALESSEATQTLANSLEVRRLREKNGMVRYAVRVKPKTVNARKRDADGKPVRVGLYAGVLEYGGKVRKQPQWAWLRRAAKEHLTEVLNAAQEEFRKSLDTAIKYAGGK